MAATNELARTNGTNDVVGPPDLRAWTAPLVDIYENDDGWLVIADLPGVAADAVDVRLEKGELVVEARRAAAEHGRPLRQGVDPAGFRRAFRVPDAVDPSAVQAELRDGVLQVHLPKSPEVKPRRVEVRAA